MVARAAAISDAFHAIAAGAGIGHPWRPWEWNDLRFSSTFEFLPNVGLVHMRPGRRKKLYRTNAKVRGVPDLNPQEEK
jgi:hypothetical protein